MVSCKELASKAIEITNNSIHGIEISYQQLDCQGFMEHILDNVGIRVNYAGSNDMFRHAFTWTGTIAEAKKLGYLVPGVSLLIVEHNNGEPAKYRGDGYGNASHIGMYVGTNALTDRDKNGNWRSCDVVHSSSSMGRVAGSTLKNGWTHVGLWKDVDYGVGEISPAPSVNQEVDDMPGVTTAVVRTPNGGDVNFRVRSNTKAPLVAKMPHIDNGETVEVDYWSGEWAHVSYGGYSGFVMAEFLVEDSTDVPDAPTQEIPETEIISEDGVNVGAVVAYLNQIRGICDLIEGTLGIQG